MQAGQVLVHDHRTLHCSPPNRTNHRRLATAIAMVPNEAVSIHYFRNAESGKVEVYEAETEFFMKYTYGKNTIPKGTRFLRHAEDYQALQFTKAEIDALKERPTAVG